MLHPGGEIGRMMEGTECSEELETMREGSVQSRGLQSHSGGSTENLFTHSQHHKLKSRSGSEYLGLSRCAACYSQKRCSKRGDGRESSSSEEGNSEKEEDWGSEEEESSSSSSSSSSVGKASSEIHETEGKDGDGLEETSETSLTPHKVVSTLNLQVLTQINDDCAQAFCIVKQQHTERDQEKTAGGIHNASPLQPFPWQETAVTWQQRSTKTPTTLQQRHQLSHKYRRQQHQPHQRSHQHQQQQQSQLFAPPFAQGQRLLPALHTLPVLGLQSQRLPHAPQTHLHALTPQTCWCCYQAPFPQAYQSHHYSGGQFPR